MIFDKFKDKTIKDVVDTAKTAVTTTVQASMDDKVRGALMLLPIVATAVIIFHDRGDKRASCDTPAHTVINNYYYGERRNAHVSDGRKGIK